MKKTIVLLIILFVIVIISVVIIPYYINTSTKVYLPKELLSENDIFLGQDVDDVLETRELLMSESVNAYYGRIKNNLFFDELRLCCKDYYFLYFSDIIEDILLKGPLSSTDSIKVDSIAIDIINILTQYWGDEYIIVDEYTYAYTKIGKSNFELIWRTDSCIISFGYIPYELHKELSNVYPNADFGYYLRIYIDVYHQSDFKESEIHTRESLGLH